MSYEYKYPQPSITGDVIVWDRKEDKILLIRRKHEPYAGHWAIVGGFFNPGDADGVMDETVRDAAIRELKEEVNLDISKVFGKFIVQRWSQYKMATGAMIYDKGQDKEFDTLAEAEEYERTADSGFGGDLRYRYVIHKPKKKCTFSFLTIQDKPNRDPRNRVVTMVYICTIWDGVTADMDIKPQDDAAEAKWFSRTDIIAGLVPLAFDHLDSIKKHSGGHIYV